MQTQLRGAIVGYGFMGRAHSNAYRQVNKFFTLDHQPILKAACGRDEAKVRAFAGNWGWQTSTWPSARSPGCST